MIKPTFRYERELLAKGFMAIVGVDEVGYGALAGPVVAGAVILPLNSRLSLIRDSKLLSAKQRDGLFEVIKEKSHAWAVGSAEVEEIIELGLRPATFLAMRRAIEQIPVSDHVLVDALHIPDLDIEQTALVGGDRLVKSIAAASILAKVYRDRLMEDFRNDFPEYGFETHKGYGTKRHLEAIKKFGPCPIHRTNYKIFRLV
ncbi:MAG: ribonuclease HII [Patescibacteria group bacterium]